MGEDVEDTGNFVYKIYREKKREKCNDLSRVIHLEAEPIPETKSTPF